MSFSFGSNQQPAFGSSAAKPAGFGTPFGAPATTTATGFGFGSTFGSTAQTPAFGAANQTPAFGSATFGAPASSAPLFGGSTFGTSNAAPAFGSTGTFGATASSAPAFGTTTTQAVGTGLFGASTSKPSLFGAPPNASLFSTPASGTTGLFGTATTQATSLFGTGTTSAAPNLFGGTTTTSAPSLFGGTFGASNTTGGGLFGTTTTSAPSLFGGFGTTTTSAPSLFGGGFGTTTTSAGGFGGFGTGTFGTATTTPSLFGGGFGQKPLTGSTTAVPTQDVVLQQTLASFYAVNVFNDERDDILKKWNMLQACWGSGKGYFGANQHVIYTPTNPLYRFKAVGYNIIVENDNSEGIVKLVFNKKESEIRSQTEVLKNGLSGILGNKPNLTVTIEDIKALGESQTEVIITVLEKGATNTTRKIPANDLAAFLNAMPQKQQLNNVGVLNITAYVSPTKSELEEYLKKPPPGIDPQMWEAAKADNPNPKKYIPVPINGFSDLCTRMHNQEHQTGLHKAFLKKVDADIAELKKKHASSIAQITELKQKFLQLQHRILRILVKQECTRKVGLTIQPEEEILRGRLETLNAHLNIPTQFKGQLNELLSCVKTIGNISRQYNERYKIDPTVQEDIKQFLKMEQTGISHLINIINSDLQALKIISEGLTQIVQSKPSYNL